MDKIYSKFLGIGFQNRVENIKNYGLTRSNSMPFYSSFQARKLPSNLSEYIPYKKRKEGFIPSDMKVQMLEEKLRKLENKQMQLTHSITNKNNDEHTYISNIQPIPIQPILIQQPLLLSNNRLNKNINIAKSYEINNEILKSRAKLNNYRGLQKQDYEEQQEPNDKIYKSIFDRKKDNEEKKEIKRKMIEKLYLNEIEPSDKQKKKRAKKFVNKLDKEIYIPLKNDFPDYMNNVNQNIQHQFEEDNKIINQEINKMEDDFNEIKIMINKKLEDMEMRQKSNFEKLKNVIKNVGGKKMSSAIENVFDGKNNDLNKAEEEYLVNEVFNLPNLIKEKKLKAEMNSIEKENKLRRRIMDQMNYELEKRREIEELKHLERLKMMEINKEKEKMENMKALNRMRYEVMHGNQNNYDNYYINDVNKLNYGISDLFNIFLLKKLNESNRGPPLNSNNLKNLNTDELLKYMLFKNMGLNNINYMDNNNYNYDPILNYNFNNSDDNRLINLNDNRKTNKINKIEENKSIKKSNKNNKTEESNSIIKKTENNKNNKNEENKSIIKKTDNKKTSKSSKNITKNNNNSKKSKSKNSNKSKSSTTIKISQSKSNSTSNKNKNESTKGKNNKNENKEKKEEIKDNNYDKEDEKKEDKEDEDKDEENGEDDDDDDEDNNNVN